VVEEEFGLCSGFAAEEEKIEAAGWPLLGVDEATATQAVEAMASNQPVVMTSSMTTFDAPSVVVTTSTVQPTTGVGSMPRTYSYVCTQRLSDG
jgi:hypothetical protein